MSAVDARRKTELTKNLVGLSLAMRRALPPDGDVAWATPETVWAAMSNELKSKRAELWLRSLLRRYWVQEAESEVGRYPARFGILPFDSFRDQTVQDIRRLEAQTMREIRNTWMEGFMLVWMHASTPARLRWLLRVTAGLGPRDVANLLSLEDTLRGKLLSQSAINAQLTNYANARFVHQNEVWGTKVVLDVQRHGERLAWEQMAMVRPDLEWVMVWVSLHDGLTRETHEEMDGVEVPVGQPWIVPNAGPQRVPGETEWGCRCRARLKLPKENR